MAYVHQRKGGFLLSPGGIPRASLPWYMLLKLDNRPAGPSRYYGPCEVQQSCNGPCEIQQTGLISTGMPSSDMVPKWQVS